MAFVKMQRTKYPPRQWALFGDPGSGKSTFAAKMVGPILVIDADHRFGETTENWTTEVYRLSDEPADNTNPERIAYLLRQNMAGSGIKTIVFDSLTAFLSPYLVQAVMDNDAGKNKNRVASFKEKAMVMRMVQDAVTDTGAATLWIYHTRSSMGANAKLVENTSIPVTELLRLRRSLNMTLKVVVDEDAGQRGIQIDWARRGRSGMVIWDQTGSWEGMPELIEAAVYDGLTEEEKVALEKQAPVTFANPTEAIGWGFEQGCFKDAVHAKNAYDKLKVEKKPKSAAEMWTLWVEDVERRVAEAGEGETSFADEPEEPETIPV